MGNKLKDLLGEVGMEELKEEARHEYNHGRLEGQSLTTGFKVGDKVVNIKSGRQGRVVLISGTSLTYPVEVRFNGKEVCTATYTKDGRSWATDEPSLARVVQEQEQKPFKEGSLVIDTYWEQFKGLVGVVHFPLGCSDYFTLQVTWETGTKTFYTADGRLYLEDEISLKRVEKVQSEYATTVAPYKSKFLAGDVVRSVVGYPVLGVVSFSKGAAPLVVTWDDGTQTSFDSDEVVEHVTNEFKVGDTVREIGGHNPNVGVVVSVDCPRAEHYPIEVDFHSGSTKGLYTVAYSETDHRIYTVDGKKWITDKEPTLAKIRLPKPQEEVVPTNTITTSSTNNGGKTDYYSLPCKTAKLKAFLMAEYGYKDGLKDDSELLDSIVATIKSFFPSTLSDLIEYKKMSPNLHEIFKATYALEERAKLKNQGNKLRELNKILFFAEREKQRLLAEQEGDLYE